MLFPILLVSISLLGFSGLLEGHPLEATSRSEGPTIDLGYARYEGTALSAGIDQFLGIRYAAPPVGDLRFRAPRDPLHQDGIQDAEVRTLSLKSTTVLMDNNLT